MSIRAIKRRTQRRIANLIRFKKTWDAWGPWLRFDSIEDTLAFLDTL